MTSSTPSAGQRFDSAAAARQAIRRGEWTTHTSGLAPAHVQGNVVILPAAQAADFLRFCQANPKPCPLLAVSDVGVPLLPTLGHDLDIRTDVPAYRVYRDGVLAEDGIPDIRALWRDDLVSFVLGCSFSFEHGLMEAGIPLRHVQQGRNVAMYKTHIATVPAGAFHGPMVVSMRPMKAADAIKAVLVTARTPRVHGAPVHIGDPALIGIADLGAPDFGDAVEVMDDELPVFWACGVTPQAIVMAARPAFCITHAPGHMLITDLRNSELPFA
ncbi:MULTISPECIES: putative hydro-lyase [unclassified Variovorax]|uniref:putative hydro-lyase n=1 Tax=unclassified Variovorax TaxID=663243 RepID=UPI0025760237|nr:MULTISPECIES: putative hydro-lyase [unclassified Variovorax]MDM0088623.1 putative hydro-lyase [Variovorax sp. J22G40]MDM0146696.1 putative hydro-lyase [Variovorax sp. J2P1-31]